jgi:enoyl-CoA hydratase/carnithine racemase
MRLLLTGDRIDAEAALRLGLIEELVEDDQLAARSRALAEQIAGYSQVATQSVKASVRMALSTPLEAGLRYENEMNALCFTTSDHYEGIKAFYEKRDAKFTGS